MGKSQKKRDANWMIERQIFGKYGRRVCVCVCLVVTVLAATYLVCISNVRHHGSRVPYRLLKICILWILLKIFVIFLP